MVRISILLFLMFALVACGGRRDPPVRYVAAPTTTTTVLFASGPISRACMASDRRAASSTRCGCVQAVADQRLSDVDQRRGASYFDDPHALQEVRQSDNASNEAFWERWKAYGAEAARLCTS